MIGNRKRIRVAYAPLNLAVSMECLTPNNPAMQTYDLASGEYEPDRDVEYTVYCPRVQASADDGSWPDQYANRLLATDTMKWYADGVDISTLAEWTDKYSVDTTDTSTKGAITIKRNITPGTAISLHFEGVIADKRLGTNVTVVSDPFILSTEEKAEDAVSLALDDDQVIRYNPFKDRLFRAEYRSAHSGETLTDTEKAAATDKNAYLREIHFSVYRGQERITDGVTLTLYRVTSASTRTEMTPGEGEYVSMATDSGRFVLTLDLRVVSKEDYVAVASIDGSERADLMVQFSVNRVSQDYDLNPTNGTDILPGDTVRYDEVMASSDGNILEHPESIVKIDWYTDTAGKTGMWHNEGNITRFEIAGTGIGNTYEDDWMDVYVGGEVKDVLCFATDEDGSQLVDENGDALIFN